MSMEKLGQLESDMEKCFRCSLCKMVPLPVALHPRFTDACPASRFSHFHGFSGSGKQIMALSLLHGRIEPDQALARIVFACTACGYCDVACKFIMDAERHRINMALREHLVENGLSPPEHSKMIENLAKTGHPQGSPERSAGSWARGLDIKVLPEQQARVLLFAGCEQRTDERAAASTRRLARLLMLAGVDVGILGDAEPCCGLPAYWTGHREVFADTASRVAGLVEGLSVRTVVVTSGSCLGAIRSKYPEYSRAMGVEVVHATEMLAGLIEQGRLRLSRPLSTRVTYHDPCYLGRQSEPYLDFQGEEKTALGCMTYTDPPRPVNRGVNGVYEAPRKILRALAGSGFVEMHRVREYSFCCGAGGGVAEAFPELAKKAALHRIYEARDVGALQLVTACRHCEGHFRRTQEQQAGEGGEDIMPVVDIIDLVFEAAGMEDES